MRAGSGVDVVYGFNLASRSGGLVRGRDYSLGDSSLALALSRDLPPRLADVLDIAMAACVVDRLEQRPGARMLAAGCTWRREFALRIGVRDREFWRKETPSDAIGGLLNWLTDDAWSLEFEPFGGTPFPSELTSRLSLPIGDSADCVALFSGGLDSLAGVLLALSDRYRPLLLSVDTNSRMAATQRRLLEMLRRRTPQVCCASVPMQVHGDHYQEPSQRARAFLFLALAGVVAAASRLRRVEVYENGIGAIALPYLPNQEGAHTTRAMHPATLTQFSDLMSLTADVAIEFTNPSLWLTKAELCQRIPEHSRALIPLTESCDTAFAYRGVDVHRCGTCTSCLLRRQALWGAGLEELDAQQTVRVDVLRTPQIADSTAAMQLLSMLDQAERIGGALGQSDPWAALVRAFPDLRDVARTKTEQRACVRLYSTYVAEWRHFPSPLVDRYLNRRQTTERGLKGGRIHG